MPERVVSPLKILTRILFEATLFFNVFVGLCCLIGPWFVVESNGTYKNCAVTTGYIVNPFQGQLCGQDLDNLLDENDEDSGRWGTIKTLVRLYFASTILIMMMVMYRKASSKTGDDDVETDGKERMGTTMFRWLLTLLDIFIVGIVGGIIAKFNDVAEPPDATKDLVFTFLVLALVNSILRAFYRLWFYTSCGMHTTATLVACGIVCCDAAQTQIDKRKKSGSRIYTIID